MAVTIDPDMFRFVVAHTPLVSIDLIVPDERGRYLVGLRKSRPAKDTWFVPGGRIAKDERLNDAFGRITEAELGIRLERSRSRFLGLYEHLYPDNFSGDTFGTHYVVLAHVLPIWRSTEDDLPDDQHSGYRWLKPSELCDDRHVHANTHAYFLPGSALLE